MTKKKRRRKKKRGEEEEKRRKSDIATRKQIAGNGSEIQNLKLLVESVLGDAEHDRMTEQ